jgi:hypothetical protein
MQVITTTSLLQGSSLCYHCKESVLHPMSSAAAVLSTSLNHGSLNVLLLLMIFVNFSWGEKFKVQDCKRGLWLVSWLMHGGDALDQTENTESVRESTEFLCLADDTSLTAAWKQRWSVLPNFKLVDCVLVHANMWQRFCVGRAAMASNLVDWSKQLHKIWATEFCSQFLW